MSRKQVCFASCLVLALVACKPADGTVQADATEKTPATESAPVSAATGKAFDEDTSAMIQGAARMQASVVACDLASRAQTDQAIAKQRARYVSKGYDGGAFDRLHGAAFEEALGKINGAGAEQKAKACEQIKAFGEKMGQMGEEMQQQMQDQH
jgi:hypothetical protein